MILLDANILVYAYVESSPQHAEAISWLEDQINGAARVGIPWASLLTFVRLTTNPVVVQRRIPATEVWEQVRTWLASPAVWLPQPTERHADVLGSLMKNVLRSEHVPDAHLAALAIEHGLTFCTTDGGFSRFPGLRWKNPLRT